MPKHHDRRRDAAFANHLAWAKMPTIWHGPKWGKRTTPRKGRRRTRFGASGTLSGAKAPLSRTFLPKRVLRRSQLAAIYESMT